MKPNLKTDIFFKKIIDENLLKITELGEIFNVQTKNKLGSINGGYIRIGYYDIKSKKRYIIQAHRLIWIKFNGLIKNNLLVNHKDGNKLNNKLDNLELCTNSENTIHAYKIGLKTITNDERKIRSNRVIGEKK